MNNQHKRIIKALKASKKGLTKPEIYEKTAVWNSGARILEIRDMGYSIEATMIIGKNRFGETTRYARYSIS